MVSQVQEVSTRPIRALVVEPADLVRRGICDVLAQYDEPIQIAADIDRPDALVETCQLKSPDVIVCSLAGAEQASALSALRRALEVRPSTRAIALLERDDAEDLLEAVRAGARAVLLRGASAGMLLAALRDVLSGHAALDPRLARLLFEWLMTTRAGAGSNVDINPAVAESLSQRERDVLRALSQGLRNKDISAQLGVSVGTVKTHLRHIFRKLHVVDRTAAVLVALRGNGSRASSG
jgi:two-component system, NarL family, response regulator LiaR